MIIHCSYCLVLVLVLGIELQHYCLTVSLWRKLIFQWCSNFKRDLKGSKTSTAETKFSFFMISVHWDLCQSVVDNLCFILNDSEKGNFPNNELLFPLRKCEKTWQFNGKTIRLAFTIFHKIMKQKEGNIHPCRVFLLAFNLFFYLKLKVARLFLLFPSLNTFS